MSANARATLRGLFAGLPSTAIVVFWAKMPLFMGLVFWSLILLPVAAITGYLAQRLLGDRATAVGPALTQVVACVAIGVIATYVGAMIVSLVAPRFLPDPFAASNLVPGVVIGSLVSFFRETPNVSTAA